MVEKLSGGNPLAAENRERHAAKACGHKRYVLCERLSEVLHEHKQGVPWQNREKTFEAGEKDTRKNAGRETNESLGVALAVQLTNTRKANKTTKKKRG